MIEALKCCICGTEYKGEFDAPCPKCEWANSGIEEDMYEEDEVDVYNGCSRKDAKEKLAKGLTKWGDPIKNSSQAP